MGFNIGVTPNIPMNELTVVIFLAVLAIFVINYVVQKRELNWLTWFMSVCSIGCTVTDEALSDMQMTIMVVPMFYVFMVSGWAAWGKR